MAFVDPGATATDAVAGVVALNSSTVVNGLVPAVYVLNYNFTDAALNAAAPVTVTVNVVDTMAPVITAPANIIAEATGRSGAVVSFNTSANDLVSGIVPTTNVPASGSVFPLGTTTVTTTAMDGVGNSASKTFTVTVEDTMAPMITVPANLTAEATGSTGTMVNFSTSATDIVDGPVPTTNTPASGFLFLLGITTVNTTATDAFGNTTNRTFMVTVRDTTAPVIMVPNPGPLTHEAGTPFVDPGATAVDAVAGVVALNSSTAVNDQVPGTYILTYRFTDAALNTAIPVSVTVNVVAPVAPLAGIVSYQGRIGAGGVEFNGNGLFKFALVDVTGTVTYWSNDGTSVAGGQPVNAVPLQVIDGLYSLRLGDSLFPNMQPIPGTAFGHGDVHLRIWFTNGINGWQQFAPDQRFSAVAYAMRTEVAEEVDNAGVTMQKFAPGAVLANLNASGLAGIPSSGLILSDSNDEAFENAGYLNLGQATDAAWHFYSWETPSGNLSGTPPVSRQGHTAVWTGDEMIVWGGWNSVNGLLNDGGRYNPTTRSWGSFSTSGAPTARLGHTSVWTGSEFIVWGGSGDGGDLGNGGHYNPLSNSWSPMTTNGAPLRRWSHSAVWTGSEMIVWGGRHLASALNDGARYNPANNTWSTLATINAPTARVFHTAVWTGSEMIVWGGYDGEGFAPAGHFGDGGRYNPASDTWTAISTIGAPTARSPGSAVWTGSEMIVWGGSDGTGTNYSNDGGRYDPNTDSWQPINTAGAPIARDGHTAVWTGEEMWIWGGFRTTGPYQLTDGGRYAAAIDSWSFFSAGAAPHPSSKPTAVWTGSRMIVWGDLSDSNDPPHNEVWTFGPSQTIFLYVRP